MSSSATTAAKRRRAGNIVTSPLFKSVPTSVNNETAQRRVNRATENIQNDTIQQLNTEVPTATDFKKPMSLQQVITVFDKRLLTLEKAIIENVNSSNVTDKTTVSINSELNAEYIEKIMETFKEEVTNTLTEQSKEFDYRTTILANEITSLKEIVIKLQSYTMDVNRSLLEERSIVFSDHEKIIKIEEDEINEEISDYTENIDEEESIQLVVEEQEEEQKEDEQKEDEQKEEEQKQEEEEEKQEEEEQKQEEDEQKQEEEEQKQEEEEQKQEEEEQKEEEQKQEEEEEEEEEETETQKKKSKRKKKEKKSLSVNV